MYLTQNEMNRILTRIKSVNKNDPIIRESGALFLYMEQPTILRALLDEGWDVNEQNDLGMTPLMIAVCKRFTPEVWRMFIDHPDIDMDKRDFRQMTAGDHAMINAADHSLLRKCIQRGYRPTQRMPGHFCIARTLINWRDSYEFCKVLLILVMLCRPRGKGGVNTIPKDLWRMLKIMLTP